ncbi:MAG: sigma-54-dependent Fis family transcriptional regulator [Deltaproteobacteria bacterium]|nr:sigma-54-dependent Fis family transcriptional regulator [Deltaproteobacteria bacterium]
MPNLLIVEDDESMLDTLSDVFREKGENVVSVPTGDAALKEFSRNQPDLVLLDIRLPDTDGLTLLKKMKETAPDLLVVIMTAYPQVQTAIQAMKAGAYDYINKPFDLDEMRLVVEKALETRLLKDEVNRFRREKASTAKATKILGESPATQQMRTLLRMVADTPRTPVLLTGESGTGKELAANAIHYGSHRAQKALVKVNCSALPDNLLEDELFGHERGAFTDAKETRKGLFEMADGGSLFLDEIAEMSPALQPKLLRILEGEPFRRVGGTREIRSDVRIIAATNRDLTTMVKAGSFRKDLYYRLKVMEMRLPTLKQRREDIPLLVEHFIALHSREMGKSAVTLSDQAAQMLMNYSWPGNVRELKNVIERAVILSNGETIERKHLPLELCKAVANECFENNPPAALDLTLEDLEREYILRILRKLGGNRTAAAKKLGISRSTLLERLKRYNAR